MIDSRDIKELHPTLQRAAAELARRMKEKGYAIGFLTYRDKEYQNKLYAQGRTTSGKVVTHAKGGQSMHNWRLAFDIFNNVAGNMYPKGFLDMAGKIGMEMGLEWGGTCFGKDFVDSPHFQWTGEYKQADIFKGKVPKDVKLKWELSAVPLLAEIKNLVAEARLKNIDHNKAYWDKVIQGKEPVNLEWWKTLKERVDK